MYHLFYWLEYESIVHESFLSLEDMYVHLDALPDDITIEACILGKELELAEEQIVVRRRLKK